MEDGSWKLEVGSWSSSFQAAQSSASSIKEPGTLNSQSRRLPAHLRPLPLHARFLSGFLAFLLFLSSSPAIYAMGFSAGMRSSGSGSQAGGGQGSAANLQNAGAASAALTAALAKQSLQKSQAVIDGLTAAQQQAAAAARADAAPSLANNNGLKVGWLELSGTPIGAAAPVASQANPNSVSIQQDSPTAYIPWKHFNVGSQTTLTFNQPGKDSVAFNQVTTASDPSHIFGTINANGQVYIQNQSGILFHNGSSVNVQSLVASTLPVNSQILADLQQSARNSQKSSLNTLDFSQWGKLNGQKQPVFGLTLGDASTSKAGDVVVQKGALINADYGNGAVMMAAPNVRNDAAASITAKSVSNLAGTEVSSGDSGPVITGQAGNLFQNGPSSLYKNSSLSDDPSLPNLTASLAPAGNILQKLDASGNVTFQPDSWSGAVIVTPLFSKVMDVTQTSQSAYLNWNKFNVGPQTTVNFNLASSLQANPSQNIVFNKVLGATDPSHIFGTIKAQGQVYILNQSGVLLHKGSSLNVNSLVAATLPINENLIGSFNQVNGAYTLKAGSGIANNPDNQFLFSALPVSTATKQGNVTPDFTPSVSGPIGDVVVEQGAVISSQPNSSGTGGLIALVAPNVRNSGWIQAPSGQVILAAGLQVALLPHPSADPSLRGMDTFIGAVADPSLHTYSSETLADTTGLTGVVLNDAVQADANGNNVSGGLISTPQGSVTMAGMTVRQLGAIDSRTSVALNGRIDLHANYNAYVNLNYALDPTTGLPVAGPPLLYPQNGTGLVQTGPGSVMQILPEWSSTDTVIGTSLALNSVVAITGANVDFGAGSILLAPGAVATAGALDQTQNLQTLPNTPLKLGSLQNGVTVNAGTWLNLGTASTPEQVFSHSQGQILLESGSVIDVSGSTDIAVSSSQNYITLQLRGAELANSPLQRTSAIRGKNITVDIRETGSYNGQYWVGTPLGDVTGYVGLIQKTVGQLTTAGGSVALESGNALILQGESGSLPAASVNVSGGWIQYSGGSFATTQLINSFGQAVNISKATPDQIYTRVLQKTTPVYEAPYVSGGNGGSITFQAPAMVLDGSIEGVTVTGSRQLRSVPGGSAGSLPASSSLNIKVFQDNPDPALFSLGESDALKLLPSSPYKPKINFESGSLPVVSKPTFLPDSLFQLGIPQLINDSNKKPEFVDLTATLRTATILLDPTLASDRGFGAITINNHDGVVEVPSGVTLALGANGSLSVTASAIRIAGNIIAPGGAISLVADKVPYSLLTAETVYQHQNGDLKEVEQDVYQAPDGSLWLALLDSGGGKTFIDDKEQTVAPSGLSPVSSAGGESPGNLSVSGTLSTAGLIVDDSGFSASRFQTPSVISGGSITLSAYSTVLDSTSVLDVSGGAYFVKLQGSPLFGNAGKISVSGGQDPQTTDIHGGTLSLGGLLSGYAGLSPNGTASGTPGSLSITAPFLVLGGQANAGGVVLSHAFFNQGGFSSFTLTGIGSGLQQGDPGYEPGVKVSSGAVIAPTISSLLPVYSARGFSLAVYKAPSGLGYAPSITLSAAGLKDPVLTANNKPLLVRGDLVQEALSQIILEPGVTISGGAAVAHVGSLTLKGMTLDEYGSVSVPGGSIALSVTGSSTSPNPTPGGLISNTQGQDIYSTLEIRAGSSLSAAGEALFVADPTGLRSRFGTVLSGGSVYLGAPKDTQSTAGANVVAMAGSVLDVSGSSGTFSDLLPGRISSYTIDSSGGMITLAGAETLYSDATLKAAAGGRSATGGTLVVSSGDGDGSLATAANLRVSQSGTMISSDPGIAGLLVNPTGDPLGNNGGGHIALSSSAGGGFSSITLGGNVLVSGSVTLDVPGSLQIASGGVLSLVSTLATPNPILSLSASYVALGQSLAAPLPPGSPALTSVFPGSPPLRAEPSWGAGSVVITAYSLMDVGNVSFKGAGKVNLSSGGSIRGDGNLVMAGDLTLQAGQIYPPTDTAFTAVAFNHDSLSGNALSSGGVPGSITIASGTPQQVPLSAGGSLALFATTINQGGTLLAPAGTITLGAISGASNPKDPMSLMAAPDTSVLNIKDGSLLSLALPSLSVPVPFGTSTDGTTWIDPAGNNITTTGIPSRAITLNGAAETLSPGAVINISGGGDLSALRWVSGLGGTLNLLGSAGGSWSSTGSYYAGDLVSYGGATWSARQANSGVTPVVGPNWTKLLQSYAILPGYTVPYAPTGYGDGSLGIGSQVMLSGGGGLAAGTYTLLPASYASLPGGYLLSISSSRNTTLPISQQQLDGTVLVSGTILNSLDRSVMATAPVTELFTLTPPAALLSSPTATAGPGRILYENLQASTFFPASLPAPADGGSLTIEATSSLSIPKVNGRSAFVNGAGFGAGSGGLLSLSVAHANFQIGGSGGTVQLDPSVLNSWTYGGLLIGGTLRSSTTGIPAPLTVTADSVTVGPGVQLSGNDVILAASSSVSIGAGASVMAAGSGLSPEELISVAGSGALLRVSSDPLDRVARSVSPSDLSSAASMDVAAGATLRGNSVTIDSSKTTLVDQSASILPGNASLNLSLSGGSVGMVLDPTILQNNLTKNDPATYDSLILSGTLLSGIQSATVLDLTSYSTLDLFGSSAGQPNASFGSPSLAKLNLHTAEIRGFDMGGGKATLAAASVQLDNPLALASTGPALASPSGSLEIDASTVTVAGNTVALVQFSSVAINASGVFAETSKSGGGLTVGTTLVPSSLTITTPLITGSAGSSLTVVDHGATVLQSPVSGATVASITPGEGSTLQFTANSIAVEPAISAPSGKISLHASTGVNGIKVGDLAQASLDVSGVTKSLLTVPVTENAGAIVLTSDAGGVQLGSHASLNLSAFGKSSAGTLSVSSPEGVLTIDTKAFINAQGGTSGGENGVFSLDTLTLNPLGVGAGPSMLSSIVPQLKAADFTQSLTLRIRSGDVDVDASLFAHSFSLTADLGFIDVSGTINASGIAANNDGVTTGGSISLVSSGNVVLESGSKLTVQADNYDAAGKGGSILLSAGAEVNGQINPSAVLNLMSGSTINLGVNAVPTVIDTLGDVGQFGGALHLRAPQLSDSSDVQIVNIASTITGASSIEMEAFKIYDLTPGAGGPAEISTVKTQVHSDANSFFANQSTIMTRLIGTLSPSSSASVTPVLNLAPGAEIINRSGDLTLTSDWDLSGFRFGVNAAPGFLTLRASGNINLRASLSDGFQNNVYAYYNGTPKGVSLVTRPDITGANDLATLMSANGALPMNFQSWSYQISAGADLNSASLAAVSGSTGDINLGVPLAQSFGAQNQNGVTTVQNLITGYYQVIRTGTGDISLNSAANVRLWNQFATIYTAGVLAPDQTLGGNFSLPQPFFTGQTANGLPGSQESATFTANRKTYTMVPRGQFSQAGGNVTIQAGASIAHVTENPNLPLYSAPIADSSAELPTGWLERRGTVSGTTFLSLQEIDYNKQTESASTAWWVDFSNFFEGVGALGGGNVTLNAGTDVSNVDAVVPINFRMKNNAPTSSATGVELGGGNLTVIAGNNIDAGVYYVEKGNGTLRAGGSIITNPTRDPQFPGASQNILGWNPAKPDIILSNTLNSDPSGYLPTTLFLGQGNFSVQALGDITLGPIANPFLLPQSMNNGIFYKTYFSTYGANDQVTVDSLGGKVTLRTEALNPTTPNGPSNSHKEIPVLDSWITQNFFPRSSLQNDVNLSAYEPWLGVVEKLFPSSLGASLDPLVSLLPPSLSIRASGDIVLQGNMTLSPSATGGLSLVSGGSIQGLVQEGSMISPTDPSGLTLFQPYASSTINVSDANPALIPSVNNPLSGVVYSKTAVVQSQKSSAGTSGALFSSFDSLFLESGSYFGAHATLQAKLNLHDNANGQPLHQGDFIPVQLVASTGDISGLTLYSPKQTDILAGGQIADVGLYIQNVSSTDQSIVSSGASMTLYDQSTAAQIAAQSVKNQFGLNASDYANGLLQSGDIQISGPGTMEILAGGSIDFGNGANNSDGTGVGITSIGNARNPSLPFGGADLIVSAGVQLPAGLSTGATTAGSAGLLNPEALIQKAQSLAGSSTYYADLLKTLQNQGFDDPLTIIVQTAGSLQGIDLSVLTAEQKARLASALFFTILSDSGLDHNNPASPEYGSYASGEKAISSFIAPSALGGNITTWARDIRTKNGGSITMMAPGGGISMASTATGSTAAPPGIVTEHGGLVDIYTRDSVSLGIGRIFTLRAGDIMIWSEKGDIAAGASAKTVASAPPTRVLIDPQSGAVLTDLAGLATGGGIGTLATVKLDPPIVNSVDLIAVSGIIDAGDAGIRSSGNLNLAATKILNADNIAVGGLSVGAPPAASSSAPAAAAPTAPAAASAPSSAASTAAAAASNSADKTADKGNSAQQDETPSEYTITIDGYGGSADDEDSKKAANAAVAPVQASL